MNRPFGEEGVPPERARSVLVPVPYEKTTTYRRGTAGGPAALLAAGTQVELHDEETGVSPLAAGVALLAPVACSGMPDQLADAVEAVVLPHLAAGRIGAASGGSTRSASARSAPRRGGTRASASLRKF